MSSTRIRLQRFGQKHRPHYRIVAAHRWAPRDGKFLEILGSYNPIPDEHGSKHVAIDLERLKKWIRNGAEPSDRVAKLLGHAEILPPAPRRSLARQILQAPPTAGNDVEEIESSESDAHAGEADSEYVDTDSFDGAAVDGEPKPV